MVHQVFSLNWTGADKNASASLLACYHAQIYKELITSTSWEHTN